MNKDEIIKLANLNNGYITPDLKAEYKIDNAYISRLLRERKLSKVARGVYITKKGCEDYYYIISLLYRNLIFSGETALVLNSLSNRIDVPNEATLPYGYKVPKIDEMRFIHTRKKTIDLGVAEIETMFGNKVRAYDKERCICDLFIRPEDFDYEDRIFAIKEYAKSYLNFEKLYSYAKQLDVFDKVQNVFEVTGWN